VEVARDPAGVGRLSLVDRAGSMVYDLLRSDLHRSQMAHYAFGGDSRNLA
jgi:hypothetical protein